MKRIREVRSGKPCHRDRNCVNVVGNGRIHFHVINVGNCTVENQSAAVQGVPLLLVRSYAARESSWSRISGHLESSMP
jgi:hypothetical protein